MIAATEREKIEQPLPPFYSDTIKKMKIMFDRGYELDDQDMCETQEFWELVETGINELQLFTELAQLRSQSFLETENGVSFSLVPLVNGRGELNQLTWRICVTRDEDDDFPEPTRSLMLSLVQTVDSKSVSFIYRSDQGDIYLREFNNQDGTWNWCEPGSALSESRSLAESVRLEREACPTLEEEAAQEKVWWDQTMWTIPFNTGSTPTETYENLTDVCEAHTLSLDQVSALFETLTGTHFPVQKSSSDNQTYRLLVSGSDLEKMSFLLIPRNSSKPESWYGVTQTDTYYRLQKLVENVKDSNGFRLYDEFL